MTSRSISIIFSLIILASLAYLGAEEYIQTNSAQNESWWTVYFEEPKGSDLDMAIENHGEKADFRWEIFLEKNIVSEGSTTLENGQKKSVPIKSTDIPKRKVTIKVYKDKEKRELYKTIE
jgi:hypothetical protein